MGLELKKLVDIAKGCGDQITIGTHDGRIHPDEVIACALIKRHCGDYPVDIIRSRNPLTLKRTDIIVDVGWDMSELEGKPVFDHHGEKKPMDNGIYHCSATLVADWLYSDSGSSYRSWHKFLLNELLYSVAAVDNNQNAITYGVQKGINLGLFSYFNPTEIEVDVTEEWMMDGFIFMLNIVEKLLDRVFQRFNVSRNIIGYIEGPIVRYNGSGIVILPKADTKTIIGYNKVAPNDKKIIACVSHNLKYNVFQVEPINVSCTSSDKLAYFPDGWSGLRGEDLSVSSGIPGGHFCSWESDYSRWCNFDSAMLAAKVLVEAYRRTNS